MVQTTAIKEVRTKQGKPITSLGSVITERVSPALSALLYFLKIQEQQLITSLHYCALMMESKQQTHKDERTAEQREVSFMLLLALDNLEFCDAPDVNIAAV